MKTLILNLVALCFCAEVAVGYEWTAMNASDTYTLICAWGSSEDAVLVGAQDGTGYGRILKYEDDTWTVMTKPDGPIVQAIWGSDVDNVWAADAWGVFYHYDGNGSNQWTSYGVVNPNPDNHNRGTPIMDIRGTDPNTIYACGFDYLGSVVLQYDGSTWSEMDISGLSTFSARSIYVRATDDIWVVGGVNTYSGSMAQYDGVAWTVTSPGYGTSYYTSIDGNDDYMIAVGARGTCAYYNGATWDDITTDDINWRCVRVAENTEALASGARGMARLHTDNIWSDELYLNYWEESFNGAAVHGRRAWLVGNKGHVYYATINPAPCDSPFVADVNCDDAVDIQDLAIMAAKWLEIDPLVSPLF